MNFWTTVTHEKIGTFNLDFFPLFKKILIHKSILGHIRRFWEYFNHIGCSTSCFILTLFLPDLVTWRSYKGWFRPWPEGIGLRLAKNIARWCYRWNIWHLSVKTKITQQNVCYQGSNGCRKKQQDLRNSDLEVSCTNNLPTFQKLWSSTKNQSFWRLLEVFWSFINIDWILTH